MKWNKNLHPIDRSWLEVRNSKVNLFEALLGGLIGAWSHLALDSMMHHDIKPFWPFLSENKFLGLLSSNSILYGCVGFFIIGIVIFIIKKK